MIQNWPDIFKLALLPHEGGYVNDPQDAGGATNKGVTQHVYDHWRLTSGLPIRSVRLIEIDEAEAIYKQLYWDACNCSLLPDGVDYAIFDFAVNSGVYKASCVLQEAVGAPVDGHVGPVTLKGVSMHHPRNLVHAICDERVQFVRKLRNFPHFGEGWVRRITEVETAALVLAAPQ